MTISVSADGGCFCKRKRALKDSTNQKRPTHFLSFFLLFSSSSSSSSFLSFFLSLQDLGSWSSSSSPSPSSPSSSSSFLGPWKMTASTRAHAVGFFLVFLAAVLLLLSGCEASVVGIDLGTEGFKGVLVKPGVPMEIVLNSETQRKTPAAVAIVNNQRVFGEDALTTVRETDPLPSAPFFQGCGTHLRWLLPSF